MDFNRDDLNHREKVSDGIPIGLKATKYNHAF